ncbi:MAG: hypothetical protein ACXABY_28200 [Candidatus Thorarchaeota archaeon]|jgi:hypothetical protein
MDRYLEDSLNSRQVVALEKISVTLQMIQMELARTNLGIHTLLKELNKDWDVQQMTDFDPLIPPEDTQGG